MLDVSAALRNPGSVFPFEENVSLDSCTVMGEELRFTDAVIKGEFFGAEDTVSIKANLTATVHAHCARCLEPVAETLKTSVEAEFSRTESEDEDVYPITGHTVDLAQPALEGLLLGLPMRFLCSESCKGLCPKCYRNRNLGLCTCPEGEVKPNPFSALKNFHYDQKE